MFGLHINYPGKQKNIRIPPNELWKAFVALENCISSYQFHIIYTWGEYTRTATYLLGVGLGIGGFSVSLSLRSLHFSPTLARRRRQREKSAAVVVVAAVWDSWHVRRPTEFNLFSNAESVGSSLSLLCSSYTQCVASRGVYNTRKLLWLTGQWGRKKYKCGICGGKLKKIVIIFCISILINSCCV